MNTFGDRLKHAIKLRGHTPASLARHLGVTPQSIYQVQSGKSGAMTASNATAAADFLRVPVRWLTDGEGTAPTLEGGDVAVWESRDDEILDDKVWVDRSDFFFSAGNGGVQWEVRERRALPFNKGFFEAIGSKPENCKLVVVKGDSMEPFLFNRDMIMIDTTKTRLKDGESYALYYADESWVKQVFKTPTGIILHSYNDKKYPDRVVSPEEMEHVTIVGEVVYRSGSGFKN